MLKIEEVKFLTVEDVEYMESENSIVASFNAGFELDLSWLTHIH